jgi:hypothetical protein
LPSAVNSPVTSNPGQSHFHRQCIAAYASPAEIAAPRPRKKMSFIGPPLNAMSVVIKPVAATYPLRHLSPRAPPPPVEAATPFAPPALALVRSLPSGPFR